MASTSSEGRKCSRIERVEVEEPGEGEVRIRIRAIGVNRTEITLRSGRARVKPPLPTKIGRGVKGFGRGDRVTSEILSWSG